ncbi:YgiQ family radical SAM protein [Methanocalculus sp.]|uniref:YgiQ family radical SAM protein n=1 Tax=Methanocalculus sp. TaxID=2004547 RepID=UPI0027226290|nr:YgiQ family radical SAM protein [Methanocalculus sp.]MDO8841630.1 YgiQ family radical SAM protein [Methanocalculus sp.]
MSTPIQEPLFLPITAKEKEKLGIDTFDIIIVSGDAYVDHPSFAAAILGRNLWSVGYTVGIISQPDWRRDEDFLALGIPRLFFAVSAGNVDSMVNAFTPNKKRRNKDTYSPGGIPKRPDRATIVYTNKLRSLSLGTGIVIGGIEASLRRFAHYDYWSDSVRQSVLADAPADLLVYGMGERTLRIIADRMSAGEPIRSLCDIPGTCWTMPVAGWRTHNRDGMVILPDYTEVKTDPVRYAEAFALHAHEQDPVRGRTVVQPHPKTVVIQNPPATPPTTGELDAIYNHPFTRSAHPSYKEHIPALEPVRFSIVSHRGCFGNCAFCALTHHQGRIVSSRSEESIVSEVERISSMRSFKGTIQDVGGPSANMYGLSCPKWIRSGVCPDRQCGPDCPSLSTDHAPLVSLLRRLWKIPGVKHIFCGSGVRFDLALADRSGYIDELVTNHVSGQLKVAPEHISPQVLRLMNKPDNTVFETFRRRFNEIQPEGKGRQYLIPYWISSHPGCTISDMIDLALYIRQTGLAPEQVQDFTPTPMTRSTTMYHTGIDPETGERVHVPLGRERQIQRALLRFMDPENETLVREGLTLSGREDLIGYGPATLIPPARRETALSGKRYTSSYVPNSRCNASDHRTPPSGRRRS